MSSLEERREARRRRRAQDDDFEENVRSSLTRAEVKGSVDARLAARRIERQQRKKEGDMDNCVENDVERRRRQRREARLRDSAPAEETSSRRGRGEDQDEDTSSSRSRRRRGGDEEDTPSQPEPEPEPEEEPAAPVEDNSASQREEEEEEERRQQEAEAERRRQEEDRKRRQEEEKRQLEEKRRRNVGDEQKRERQSRPKQRTPRGSLKTPRSAKQQTLGLAETAIVEEDKSASKMTIPASNKSPSLNGNEQINNVTDKRSKVVDEDGRKETNQSVGPPAIKFQKKIETELDRSITSEENSDLQLHNVNLNVGPSLDVKARVQALEGTSNKDTRAQTSTSKPQHDKHRSQDARQASSIPGNAAMSVTLQATSPTGVVALTKGSPRVPLRSVRSSSDTDWDDRLTDIVAANRQKLQHDDTIERFTDFELGSSYDDIFNSGSVSSACGAGSAVSEELVSTMEFVPVFNEAETISELETRSTPLANSDVNKVQSSTAPNLPKSVLKTAKYREDVQKELSLNKQKNRSTQKERDLKRSTSRTRQSVTPQIPTSESSSSGDDEHFIPFTRDKDDVVSTNSRKNSVVERKIENVAKKFESKNLSPKIESMSENESLFSGDDVSARNSVSVTTSVENLSYGSAEESASNNLTIVDDELMDSRENLTQTPTPSVPDIVIHSSLGDDTALSGVSGLPATPGRGRSPACRLKEEEQGDSDNSVEPNLASGFFGVKSDIPFSSKKKKINSRKSGQKVARMTSIWSKMPLTNIPSPQSFSEPHRSITVLTVDQITSQEIEKSENENVSVESKKRHQTIESRMSELQKQLHSGKAEAATDVTDSRDTKESMHAEQSNRHEVPKRKFSGTKERLDELFGKLNSKLKQKDVEPEQHEKEQDEEMLYTSTFLAPFDSSVDAIQRTHSQPALSSVNEFSVYGSGQYDIQYLDEAREYAHVYEDPQDEDNSGEYVDHAGEIHTFNKPGVDHTATRNDLRYSGNLVEEGNEDIEKESSTGSNSRGESESSNFSTQSNANSDSDFNSGHFEVTEHVDEDDERNEDPSALENSYGPYTKAGEYQIRKASAFSETSVASGISNTGSVVMYASEHPAQSPPEGHNLILERRMHTNNWLAEDAGIKNSSRRTESRHSTSSAATIDSLEDASAVDEELDSPGEVRYFEFPNGVSTNEPEFSAPFLRDKNQHPTVDDSGEVLDLKLQLDFLNNSSEDDGEAYGGIGGGYAQVDADFASDRCVDGSSSQNCTYSSDDFEDVGSEYVADHGNNDIGDTYIDHTDGDFDIVQSMDAMGEEILQYLSDEMEDEGPVEEWGDEEDADHDAYQNRPEGVQNNENVTEISSYEYHIQDELGIDDGVLFYTPNNSNVIMCEPNSEESMEDVECTQDMTNDSTGYLIEEFEDDRKDQDMDVTDSARIRESFKEHHGHIDDKDIVYCDNIQDGENLPDTDEFFVSFEYDECHSRSLSYRGHEEEDFPGGSQTTTHLQQFEKALRAEDLQRQLQSLASNQDEDEDSRNINIALDELQSRNLEFATNAQKAMSEFSHYSEAAVVGISHCSRGLEESEHFSSDDYADRFQTDDVSDIGAIDFELKQNLLAEIRSYSKAKELKKKLVSELKTFDQSRLRHSIVEKRIDKVEKSVGIESRLSFENKDLNVFPKAIVLQNDSHGNTAPNIVIEDSKTHHDIDAHAISLVTNDGRQDDNITELKQNVLLPVIYSGREEKRQGGKMELASSCSPLPSHAVDPSGSVDTYSMKLDKQTNKERRKSIRSFWQQLEEDELKKKEVAAGWKASKKAKRQERSKSDVTSISDFMRANASNQADTTTGVAAVAARMFGNDQSSNSKETSKNRRMTQTCETFKLESDIMPHYLSNEAKSLKPFKSQPTERDEGDTKRSSFGDGDNVRGQDMRYENGLKDPIHSRQQDTECLDKDISGQNNNQKVKKQAPAVAPKPLRASLKFKTFETGKLIDSQLSSSSSVVPIPRKKESVKEIAKYHEQHNQALQASSSVVKKTDAIQFSKNNELSCRNDNAAPINKINTASQLDKHDNMAPVSATNTTLPLNDIIPLVNNNSTGLLSRATAASSVSDNNSATRAPQNKTETKVRQEETWKSRMKNSESNVLEIQALTHALKHNTTREPLEECTPHLAPTALNFKAEKNQRMFETSDHGHRDPLHSPKNTDRDLPEPVPHPPPEIHQTFVNPGLRDLELIQRDDIHNDSNSKRETDSNSKSQAPRPKFNAKALTKNQLTLPAFASKFQTPSSKVASQTDSFSSTKDGSKDVSILSSTSGSLASLCSVGSNVPSYPADSSSKEMKSWVTDYLKDVIADKHLRDIDMDSFGSIISSDNGSSNASFSANTSFYGHLPTQGHSGKIADKQKDRFLEKMESNSSSSAKFSQKVSVADRINNMQKLMNPSTEIVPNKEAPGPTQSQQQFASLLQNRLIDVIAQEVEEEGRDRAKKKTKQRKPPPSSWAVERQRLFGKKSMGLKKETWEPESTSTPTAVSRQPTQAIIKFDPSRVVEDDQKGERVSVESANEAQSVDESGTNASQTLENLSNSLSQSDVIKSNIVRKGANRKQRRHTGGGTIFEVIEKFNHTDSSDSSASFPTPKEKTRPNSPWISQGGPLPQSPLVSTIINRISKGESTESDQETGICKNKLQGPGKKSDKLLEGESTTLEKSNYIGVGGMTSEVTEPTLETISGTFDKNVVSELLKRVEVTDESGSESLSSSLSFQSGFFKAGETEGSKVSGLVKAMNADSRCASSSSSSLANSFDKRHESVSRKHVSDLIQRVQSPQNEASLSDSSSKSRPFREPKTGQFISKFYAAIDSKRNSENSVTNKKLSKDRRHTTQVNFAELREKYNTMGLKKDVLPPQSRAMSAIYACSEEQIMKSDSETTQSISQSIHFQRVQSSEFVQSRKHQELVDSSQSHRHRAQDVNSREPRLSSLCHQFSTSVESQAVHSTPYSSVASPLTSKPPTARGDADEDDVFSPLGSARVPEAYYLPSDMTPPPAFKFSASNFEDDILHGELAESESSDNVDFYRKHSGTAKTSQQWQQHSNTSYQPQYRRVSNISHQHQQQEQEQEQQRQQQQQRKQHQHHQTQPLPFASFTASSPSSSPFPPCTQPRQTKIHSLPETIIDSRTATGHVRCRILSEIPLEPDESGIGGSDHSLGSSTLSVSSVVQERSLQSTAQAPSYTNGAAHPLLYKPVAIPEIHETLVPRKMSLGAPGQDQPLSSHLLSPRRASYHEVTAYQQSLQGDMSNDDSMSSQRSLNTVKSNTETNSSNASLTQDTCLPSGESLPPPPKHHKRRKSKSKFMQEMEKKRNLSEPLRKGSGEPSVRKQALSASDVQAQEDVSHPFGPSVARKKSLGSTSEDAAVNTMRGYSKRFDALWAKLDLDQNPVDDMAEKPTGTTTESSPLHANSGISERNNAEELSASWKRKEDLVKEQEEEAAREEEQRKERERMEAEEAARVKAEEEAKKKKGKRKGLGGLSAEKKKLLKKLIMQKAAEDLRNEAKEKAAEKEKYINDRVPVLRLEGMGLNDLQQLVKDLHAKVSNLEEEVYDWEIKIRKQDFEINELTLKVNDTKGKFIKPVLRKVNKTESKLKKLQTKESTDFRGNLKSTGQNKYALDEEEPEKSNAHWRDDLKSKEKGEEGAPAEGEDAVEVES